MAGIEVPLVVLLKGLTSTDTLWSVFLERITNCADSYSLAAASNRKVFSAPWETSTVSLKTFSKGLTTKVSTDSPVPAETIAVTAQQMIQTENRVTECNISHAPLITLTTDI